MVNGGGIFTTVFTVFSPCIEFCSMGFSVKCVRSREVSVDDAFEIENTVVSLNAVVCAGVELLSRWVVMVLGTCVSSFDCNDVVLVADAVRTCSVVW